METVVRAIDASEIPKFVRTDAAGFGESEDYGTHAARWIALELERTRAAFEGDDLVATSRNYSLELTVPGGGTVPAAGVSAVAVLPTHRRRGILRSMMTALFDDAVERGEPVAMLTASEGAIYQRFGFGVSTRAAAVELDRRTLELARLPEPGRLRMVQSDELRKQAAPVFDRVRQSYPGAVSRPEVWWTDVLDERESGQQRYHVLYESPQGALDGFVTYTVEARWDHGPTHVLRVVDLVAATPEATRALWRYLCEVDLVRTIRARRTPLDSPLPWLLTSPRAARVLSIDDFVWTRILDVPAALAARRYAVEGRLVVAVHDASRPGGAADGTFTIDAGPDGATVARGGTPELACDVATLSAAWLGGLPFTTLAAAGWIDEHTPGALARADAMFASTPLPYPFTWF
jgi:predicted acetyltransferase